MPNLTITVTAEQATRIADALTDHYAGTALALDTLANQAKDFLMSAMRQQVREYEESRAVKNARVTITEL